MSGSKQINKSAIRNFAIEARNILIKSAVKEAGFYGITKDEIKAPKQCSADFEVYETMAGTERRIFDADIRRRRALVEAIHLKGFDEVMEETAYTWFNRLIAIRFMEVNHYLPFRTRILSSDSGSITPDIVSRSMEVNLGLSDAELAAVQKAKDENAYDGAFRLLFIRACNALNDLLPGLFEKTDDYMELLLNLPYTSDGVVRMLVDTIPESNFNVNEGGQVEIIGWLYQYYNTEPKAMAFAKKGKITKEEIPAVTQLFTPDWIVRYMVENSLGRIWIEHLLANGDSRSEQEIADDFGWNYYLPEAEQEPEVQAQLLKIRADRKSLTPEEILCMDPCQGSGHILVYLFDVLMQIYREEGYSERDAARSILEHNLFGLDIDDRAYQLSYFAVLMKARQYDRMILKKKVQPHVYSIRESNTVDRNHLKYLGVDMDEAEKNHAIHQITGILDTFQDAKEYGSILSVDSYDWVLLHCFVENDRIEGQMAFDAIGIDKTQKKLLRLLEIAEVMAQKYLVVTTNPPYMTVSNGSAKLNEYIRGRYPNSKADLFSVFIERCGEFLQNNAYQAMITMHAWMFISSYANFRDKLYLSDIVNMAHLGARAFDEIGGEVVQTTSFVIRKAHNNAYKGTYCRLLVPKSEDSKREMFLSGKGRYFASSDDFRKINGQPLAYWVPKDAFLAFGGMTLDDVVTASVGIQTGDNNKFILLWWEPEYSSINLTAKSVKDSYGNKRWFPYNKGGEYRKWFGNDSSIVNWRNNGEEVISNSVATGHHYQQYGDSLKFKPLVTWSRISTGTPAFRLKRSGFLSDMAGFSLYANLDDLKLILAYCNSKVVRYYLEFLAPTLNIMVGSVLSLPYLQSKIDKDYVIKIVDEIMDNSEADWNTREVSWGFKRHFLVGKYRTIKEAFYKWENACEERFELQKSLEEELNDYFISTYELVGVVDPIEKKEDISIHLSEKTDIKTFVSYAVGCMFGRYSLDVDGLAYAGGDWEEARATKYKTFLPDEDAIIPITDEEYFKDDIVARFVEFVRVVYGTDTLEENLKYIARALGGKGDTSRAVIRNYFLNDFYKDHCNTYSVTGSGKRPIYWLFDSGKQNGFKALIYIHRYTPDTVGLIRSVYLHNAQAAIQNSLQNSEYIIATTTSAPERARETRKRDKYVKQLNELRPYYQALSHIALQRIPMDLDDGVKKNYQLFQGIEVSTEGQKKQTIDLLAKI